MINISRTATLTPYLLAVFEDGRRHPAVIILPGGGYVYTTPHEAAPVAAMFNTVDCQSFVLDYTTYTKDPQVTNDMMLEEVKQSLELLKKNADQWHIDTSRLYLCGFSAGGHLAALASNEYPDEIDRVILGYAALDLKGIPYKGEICQRWQSSLQESRLTLSAPRLRVLSYGTPMRIPRCRSRLRMNIYTNSLKMASPVKRIFIKRANMGCRLRVVPVQNLQMRLTIIL